MPIRFYGPEPPLVGARASHPLSNDPPTATARLLFTDVFIPDRRIFGNVLRQ